ncbi:lipid storage droplets surface-binding protein 2-like [Aphidius gifuensis]|nr:lipid storage droplets surface-binding protein 2-like [Aphidius gifuensis]
MATQTVVMALPQIEVFNRVLGLPMVEQALAVSSSTYLRVKDSHQLFNWILTTAESSLSSATSIAAPFAKKFETPIHFFDNKLCMGLDKIEEKVPMVKETPEQIFEKGYMFALQTVQPAVSKISFANDLILSQAASLKELSWNKANQILSTYYGTVAIHGLDSTAIVVDKLIDKYFPATGTEIIQEPTSSEEDKLLHTLQTVGRLSNKAARRVYGNVIFNLRTINRDKVKLYVGNIVEFLQITHYLHAVNEKVHGLTNNTKNSSVNHKNNNKKKSKGSNGVKHD